MTVKLEASYLFTILVIQLMLAVKNHYILSKDKQFQVSYNFNSLVKKLPSQFHLLLSTIIECCYQILLALVFHRLEFSVLFFRLLKTNTKHTQMEM